MLDYERLYRILFNGITDALDIFETEGYIDAKETLIRAQQAAEDYYIGVNEDDDGGAICGDSGSCPVYVLPHDECLGEKPKSKKPYERFLDGRGGA